MKYSPWVFSLILGTHGIELPKYHSPGPDGRGADTPLTFGIERASRCSAGTHNCHQNAVCTFRRGEFTFQCTCRRGYVGNGEECGDLDECVTHRHDCSDNEACVNTDGGFYCKENKGHVRVIGQACYDGTHTCDRMATCVPDNNKKGYDCLCFEGFHGNGNKKADFVGRGGKKGCHDIDECKTFNQCDAHGQNCINTFGSYVCSSVPDPDHVCSKGQHECHERAKCIPNPKRKRKYDCECVSGYKGNGNAQFILGDPGMIQQDHPLTFGPNGPKGCVDIDECDEGSHNCVAQSCFNQPGSFYCSSDPDPAGVCDPGRHECHPNALCVVSASNRGYDCVCKAGYAGNGNALWSRADGFFDTIAMSKGKKGCWDIDECASHQHNCLPGFELCHNVHPKQGKFICIPLPNKEKLPCLNNNHNCPMGYTCYQTDQRPYYACVDDNECSLGTHDCSIHQDCMNVPGTYKCLGLADPNNVCSSFNPCANNANGLTRCVVTYNSYQCVDRDECFDGSHTCHHSQYCVDVPGSFLCKPPYDPDPWGLCSNFECQDNASCLLSADKKTRSCICKPGFTEDATTGMCLDTDECTLSPTICGFEFCVNEFGGYKCLNATAFSDLMCSLVTEPCGTLDVNAKCYGQGSMAAPVTKCVCSSAFYTADVATGKCVDTLECSNPLACSAPGATCMEQVGAAPICDTSADPHKFCTPNNPCGVHGTCALSADKMSYACTCNAGFFEGSLNAAIKTCLDIDECADPALNTCNIYESCDNQPGGYKCDHNPDPFGKCLGFNNKCTGMAQCVVSQDKLSSSCKCPTGYYWGQDWQGAVACQDIDECSTGSHTCSAYEYCANMPGTYYCGLHAGPCAYGQHECHPMATCRPSYSKRGYDCDCIPGFKGNGNAEKSSAMRHLLVETFQIKPNKGPQKRPTDAWSSQQVQVEIEHSHGSLISYGPNGPKGCVDVDECQAGIAQCVAGQQCVNSIGGFECTNEYDPWGKCTAGQHECHPLAVCTPNINVKRGYDCTCQAGFEGNGNFQFGRQDAIAMGANGPKGCVDVNECATGRDKCSTYQSCVNLEGGYSCIGDFDPHNKCGAGVTRCNQGQNCIPNAYTFQGYSCQDIDECLEGIHGCTVNQLCVNVNYEPGRNVGFKCMGPEDPQQRCVAGSEGDKTCSAIAANCKPDNSIKGFTCHDVDECLPTSPCNPLFNEKCINKVNGFFCTNATDPFGVCANKICVPNASCRPSTDLMSAECPCDAGFTTNSANECVDIDECLSTVHGCTGMPPAGNGICVNTMGNYTCATGADPFGVCATTCDNTTSTCVVGASFLTATCTCNPGWEQVLGSNTLCVDIDECTTNPTICPNANQFCVNLPGSHNCSTAADPYGVCALGSLGDVTCFHQGVNGSHCSPDDNDNRQSFLCNCNAGYNNTGHNGACQDIDECAAGSATLCAAQNNTVCVNELGSFRCDNSTDPHGICAPGNHKCGPYGACKVIGANKDAYTCDCVSTGYQLDAAGLTCIDINECAGSGVTCAADEFCLNTIGSYKCTNQNKEDPNGLCDTLNNPNALKCVGVSASCAVSVDKLSAYCFCPIGFYYTPSAGCLDVNECLFSMMHLCTSQEKCMNTVGSYTCHSHPDPLGKCAAAKCDPRADCRPNYSNKRGYDCICRVGWYGNGNFQFSRNDISFGANAPKGCKDVDECKNNLHDCAMTGQYCQNTEGSFTCSNKPNPGHPCTTGGHKCHHLATCMISYTNKVGYTCECNKGFKGNGKKQFSSITGAEIAQGGPKGCVDVDECKFNTDNCKHGQFCFNTIGSYTCHGQASANPCASMSCSTGLECRIDQMTGQAGCADVNECLNVNICQKGTHCVNNYASYNCVPDAIPYNPCAAGTHSCNIYQECVAQGNVAICQDRNECVTAGHDCNAFQSCYNTNPGWMCFDDHNSLCRGNRCHHKATCVANPLMKEGYDCVCNSGYHGNGNMQFRFEDEISFGPNGPKGCEDINECKSSVFPCAQGNACINSDGGYHCMPVLDGTDVHGYCTFGAHNCDPLATCVPNPSSKRGFECVCRSGYKGNGNMQMRAEIDEIAYGGAKGCVDIDECEDDPNNRCSFFQMCFNTAGSYQCLGDPDPFNACAGKPCGAGFDCRAANSYKGYSCDDVDECAKHLHGCAANQVCINYPGAYACHNATIVQPITVIGKPTGTIGPTILTTTKPPTNAGGPCSTTKCAKGWECVQVGVIGQCIDIDECYRNDTSCKWGEICSNYPGGFLCLEDPDYVCRHDAHTCDKLATCIPLKEPSQGHRKGYDCKCPTGYFGNGNNKPSGDKGRFDKPKGCTDMNECLDLPCRSNETCINSAGSYFCYPNGPNGNLDPFQYETPCTVNECDHRANCVLNYESKRGYDCVCKAGFHGNGNAQYRADIPSHSGPKGCVNFDECAKNTHNCGMTQGCIDTEGSFMCVPDPYGVCFAGRHTCNEFSVCRPKPGQLWDHECECRVGSVDQCMEKCGTTWSFCYRTCLLQMGGKANVCKDVDECAMGLHDCPTGSGTMLNGTSNLSYECINQNPGFTCSNATDPFELCLDNGPCDNSTSTCQVTPTNKTEVTCDCNSGFNGYVDIPTNTTCIDIDECVDGSHNCNAVGGATPTTCVNLFGTFNCTTDTDPYGVCTNKDPSNTTVPHNCGTFPCRPIGTFLQDYDCDCAPFGEFDQVTKSCIDYDECQNLPPRPSWVDPCPPPIASNGFCLNKPFALHECSMLDDPLNLCASLHCGTNSSGSCEVAPSKTTAHCKCNLGYFLNPKKTCEDVNECDNPAVHKCGTVGHPDGHPPEADFCINLPGTFNCTANADPFGVCAEGAHNCGWRGVCTPDAARTSQICTCEKGYYDICETACEFSLDPLCYPSCLKNLFGKQRCKNVNECDDYKPTHTCLATENCADLDGSFDCLSQCELANVCDTDATCVADYSEEGFHCKCKAGYHGNGKLQTVEVAAGLYGEGSYKAPKGCKDIDECHFGLHNCTGIEVCVNTDGGFNCSTAHDPHGSCAWNSHDCHPLAHCVPNLDNKRGYECECMDGYYGNGNFQFISDSGRKRRIAEGLSYLGYYNGERGGSPTDLEELAYLNSIPSYEEVVANGANAPKGCVNIDECFYGLDKNCGPADVCFDTVGSYVCTPSTTTPAPPTLAPTVCFMAQNECDADADCFADPIVPGGTYCKCHEGFRGDGSVRSDERGMKTRGCEDIDECAEKLDACKPFDDEYCSNTYGSYECLTNTLCKGITKCHPVATCNPIGETDYDCHCPDGYEGFGLGPRGCYDKDECGDGTNKCHETALCFNKMADQGKYECRCLDHCKDCPNKGGLLPNPVAAMEPCQVPDTQVCGDLASHYKLGAGLVVEDTPCKVGKNGNEECTFTCANGTSTAKPAKVTCDRKRKTWMDGAGTEINCVAPADTKCGNLLEMPFATFLLDPDLGWGCRKGKESKKGYTEVCEFKCAGVLAPTHKEVVEICEVKGKDEVAMPKPGAISDFIYCVNPNHYTDCGVITDDFLFVNGSDANCTHTDTRDNLCEFTCPSGMIPTIKESKCYTNKFQGWYEGGLGGPAGSKTVVDCIPKPPDTPCGNVKDTYVLQKEQGFTVMDDGITVIFDCGKGNEHKLPMPAYTVCNTFQAAYEHDKGTKIRCV